jgi:putative transposase
LTTRAGIEKEVKRRAGVVGIFPNEASITRLIGAVLLEQNDVYGPPPICKNDHAAMETGLAVVHPALSRGDTAAGPDGIRGSATGQMDELAMARIISMASAEPGLTGSPPLCVTLASGRRNCARRRAAYAA